MMDALTDPMIASQMGRLERRIAELEADRSKAWETCQKAVERGMTLEAENRRLLKLKAAVEELPVEEWVEQEYDGYPYLVGYVMQAQGEWDAVRQALAALEGG